MREKGVFVVFEGPDKSGKTTQAKLLKDYLERKGEKVVLTREPGGTEISEKIRDIILDPKNKISPLCELFLYEASRADNVENIIKPSLEKGYIVISDRFTMATLAYQGFGRGIDRKIISILNKIATSDLTIDIIFGFDIDEKEYFRRSGDSSKDRIERERGFIKKVINSYRQIYKKTKNIILIDGRRPIEDIHKTVVDEVEKRLKRLR